MLPPTEFDRNHHPCDDTAGTMASTTRKTLNDRLDNPACTETERSEIYKLLMTEDDKDRLQADNQQRIKLELEKEERATQRDDNLREQREDWEFRKEILTTPRKTVPPPSHYSQQPATQYAAPYSQQQQVYNQQQPAYNQQQPVYNQQQPTGYYQQQLGHSQQVLPPSQAQELIAHDDENPTPPGTEYQTERYVDHNHLGPTTQQRQQELREERARQQEGRAALSRRLPSNLTLRANRRRPPYVPYDNQPGNNYNRPARPQGPQPQQQGPQPQQQREGANRAYTAPTRDSCCFCNNKHAPPCACQGTPEEIAARIAARWRVDKADGPTIYLSDALTDDTAIEYMEKTYEQEQQRDRAVDFNRKAGHRIVSHLTNITTPPTPKTLFWGVLSTLPRTRPRLTAADLTALDYGMTREGYPRNKLSVLYCYKPRNHSGISTNEYEQRDRTWKLFCLLATCTCPGKTWEGTAQHDLGYWCSVPRV